MVATPHRTVAVIVTYHPDLAELQAQIDRLRPQVGGMVIIDNASGDAWQSGLHELARSADALLKSNDRNLGVAAALNQGIELARDREATHVLLMDQDSLPDADMVRTLHAALARLAHDGPVAAVGPAAVDVRSGAVAPFVRVAFPLNRKLQARAGECLRCDFLITSGTLIPMEVLDRIGMMDAGLFIDNVDLEWAFRASKAGFALYGVADARMGHRIGDGIRKLPLGASFVHSPLRLYYIMRNRVLLYRRRDTPLVWTAQDIPRAMLKLLRFSLLVAPRVTNARFMLAGLRDGLLGRSGAKNGTS